MHQRTKLLGALFLLLFFFYQPSTAELNEIAQGGDVFIGEEGLDVTNALGGFSSVAWFASGTNPNTDTPKYIVAVGTPASFYAAPADFVGRTGNWYRWNGAIQGVAFHVVDPVMEIKVWDQNTNKDISGKQVPAGNFLNFRVETNTYSVVNRLNYAGEGFITVKVKSSDGSTFTALNQNTISSIPLTGQAVDSSLWYWVEPAGNPTVGWNTAATDSVGSRLYKAGTYTVSAELALNKIKDNYKAPDGSYYTGKTLTAMKTVALFDSLTPAPTPTLDTPSVHIRTIAQGGDVFVGEEGLDIASAVGGYSNVAWFATGTNPNSDIPHYIIPVNNPTSFFIQPADFLGRTGNWYRWSGSNKGVAFNVVDPYVDVKIWNQNTNTDVTGKQVPVGTFLNFRVNSNLYSVVNRPDYAGEGFIDLKVKAPNGTFINTLAQDSLLTIPLAGQSVDSSVWYWVSPSSPQVGWNTASISSSGTRLYQGVYTIIAEVNLNKIRINYRAPDGSTYTGKTVSPLKTISLIEPTPTPTPIPTSTQPTFQTVQYELFPGWNFVSTPKTLIVGKNSAGNVFSGVNLNGHSMFTYDATNSTWKRIKNEDVIQPLHGIWIYSADHVFGAFYLVDDSPIISEKKELNSGWNSVGFFGISHQSAKNALFPVNDQWSSLIGFDASKQVYEPTIIKNGAGTHSDSSPVLPTKGYWLKMESPGTLGGQLSPTVTQSPVPTPNYECDCTSDLFNCGDFPSGEAAQACYNHCISLGKGDVHGLDGDDDGFACESF